MKEATLRAVDVQEIGDPLGRIIDQVRDHHERLVIEQDGVAVAAMVPLADLRRLRQFDEIWADGTAAMERVSDAFADVPVPELERQVELALAEVRAEMRAEREAAHGQ